MVDVKSMNGPLGGYDNPPELTVQRVTGSGTTNIDIRPDAGHIWAPTFISLVMIAPIGASTGHTLIISLFDGTTAYNIARTYTENLTFAGSTSISFGSSESGPILLTNDKYLRLTVIGTNANADTHVFASINKVI